ncbi:putative sodium bicarbonate transporter-like protein 11 isoform X3 [Apostichopus japonicus]|uniref:Putative sodium bicarbonate transporter-like protein 11 isoform X3 n=1 Tax=Stichopus japonicus TaxID=307972 RepID=A0A2G8L1M2_STIJA|nr:putative sodium bicarbonate transporter-like protein 11 isoform X3 [Apostichopus japonicus]
MKTTSMSLIKIQFPRCVIRSKACEEQTSSCHWPMPHRQRRCCHPCGRFVGRNDSQDRAHGGSLSSCFHTRTKGCDVHVLAKTIQGTSTSEGGGFDYDQSWVCALCSLPSLQKRYVGIARLRSPANLGRTSQEVRFVILVLAPFREKSTKNALETARTFATLLADMDCRQMLLEVKTEEEFKRTLTEHAKELAIQQSHPSRIRGNSRPSVTNAMDMFASFGHNWFPGRGLYLDLRRRLPNYISDFTDGIMGTKSIHKLISTTLFLYFACLLPSIAFGVLNAKNTGGSIGSAFCSCHSVNVNVMSMSV